MKKLDLTKWAAISEITGTAAVIVSLLFVAYSINRNTLVMQSLNDNFLYQTIDSRLSDIVSEPEVAHLLLKWYGDEELSAIETERFFYDQIRRINMWELAFDRHKEGLLSPDKWNGWNRNFANDFPNTFPQEWWKRVRVGYGDGFARHVDAVYSEE